MKVKTNSDTLRKVLKVISSYHIFLILSIIFAAVSVILQLYIPLLFGDAIDHIIAEGKVDFAALGIVLSKILTLVVITSIATWIMNMLNNTITYRVVRDIRSRAIRQIQSVPLGFIDQHSVGDIVSRVIADADQLSDGLLLGFNQLFSGIIMIIVTLIFMFSKSITITLFVVIMTPVSFIVAKFIAQRSFSMFKLQSETRGEETALIDEMIGNAKVVKAFGYEDDSSARFNEINLRLQKYSQNAVFYSSLVNPSTRFVNSVIYAIVTLAGAFSILRGSLTVGGLSVLLNYANQYMKPFNDISAVITALQNALACAARLFELIEKESESNGSTEMSEATGEVDIENVSFSYVKEKKLIEDFSLKVKPGTRVAIVGPTGCG
ncbi:MAG: ABC transporter ATP-binding protein, partial [Lachnospiraceae bacterium]|nr:ABC transporter ATP-binding protein [Lachnospiraceae bacterium]